MNLLDRINKEIVKIKSRNDRPTIIWLGKEEKYEFEKLVKEITTIKETPKKDKSNEIYGVPVRFVSSERWLTISYEENKF